jgi:hypothetical protein
MSDSAVRRHERGRKAGLAERASRSDTTIPTAWVDQDETTDLSGNPHGDHPQASTLVGASAPNPAHLRSSVVAQ